MKKTLLWIAGFILGIICFAIGNALILIVDQILFSYVNYWVAAIIATTITLFSIYKLIDYSFFFVPYVLVGNRTTSLLYVFIFLIITACLYSLYNHEFFKRRV